VNYEVRQVFVAFLVCVFVFGFLLLLPRASEQARDRGEPVAVEVFEKRIVFNF